MSPADPEAARLAAEAGAILRTRAAELARPEASASPDREALTLLEFRLGRERYAVDVSHVREVYPLRELVSLPGTPRFLPGIVNVRGRIVAVLDLREFFGLQAVGLTDLHRVILVEGGGMEVGLLADQVSQVVTYPVTALHVPPETLEGVRAGYLRGVTAERLIVLDVAGILADPRIVVDSGADITDGR